MPQNRSAQFRTETPFLPQPIAGAILEELVSPFDTIEAGEALHTRIASFRTQVSAAIDTIELAISDNHAAYLGGRHSWSYETRIEIDTRLRILKRQRQHLQEAFGQCNRRLKRLIHVEEESVPPLGMPEASRAIAFVQAATQILDPMTMTLIWEIVEHRERPTALRGVPTENNT